YKLFRQRLIQLLASMFTFDERHLSAVLHPQYRKLTFATTYDKGRTHSFIRQEMEIILGVNDSNPLLFWHDYQSRFPTLAILARRLFSIPATSAGVERQFSAAGLIINERRASLNPETVEDILFVRSMERLLVQSPNFFV
ncbi:unnamed protein product, partial [Didymodactylos carnosus]